jgi:hypothetical protein
MEAPAAGDELKTRVYQKGLLWLTACQQSVEPCVPSIRLTSLADGDSCSPGYSPTAGARSSRPLVGSTQLKDVGLRT